MMKKLILAMLMMLTVMFAEKYDSYFDNGNVKPLVFSVMDSKNEAENPNSDVTTNFHLTLFSGRVKNVLGLQLGLISNDVANDFIGYDGTFIYSRVGGNYAGYQTTGLVNRVEGEFTGIQESGIYSYIGENLLGFQTAGIIGKVMGDVKGAQFAGIINEAKDVTGAQFSGIVNKADDVEGAQFTGVVNNAKDVTGIQSSGIVNNAGHVKGIQIGLVNRSKKLDGIAIGLVNVSEEGSVHAIGWAGGAVDYQAGLKFAPNDYWYTILTFGDIQNDGDLGDNHTFQSYMGLQYPVMSKVYVAADIGTGIALPYNVEQWENEEDIWGIFEARVSVGYKIFDRLTVFGGVSQSYYGHGDDEKFDDFEEIERTRPFFGIQF